MRAIAQDRVLVHRQLVSQYLKIFEILEYLGFVSRREASRALKSGGRGPIFAINLCSLLDSIPSKRLTFEMIEDGLQGSFEPAEIHTHSWFYISGDPIAYVPEEHGLAILDKPVTVLGRSPAYPYGLTSNIMDRLTAAGMKTVGRLANSSDRELDRIDYIGAAKIKFIRDVVYQAIWM